MTKTTTIISWSLQVLVALILFQTLFFKFTGAEESRYIFQTLGLEPAGRIASGVAELVAVVLLLTPRTVVWGAVLALGVISGAIASHLTRLGIVVRGDGGLLFGLALAVFVGSAAIVFLRRSQIPMIGALRDGPRRDARRHLLNPTPARLHLTDVARCVSVRRHPDTQEHTDD